MAHNLVYLARMLNDDPIPAEGNPATSWHPPGEAHKQPAGHVA